MNDHIPDATVESIHERLPIATQDPEKWAESWIARYSDKALLERYQQKHSEYALLSDAFVGDLPWDKPTNEAVVAKILESSHLQTLYVVWTNVFGTADNLRGWLLG